MSVRDDLIRKNPFHFDMTEILKNDSKKINALSEEDEERFLTYVKDYEKFKRANYFDYIMILLKTGLKSELCGLTINDIDFENRKINISKQLIRAKDMQYRITTLKTKSSYRELQMADEIYQYFQNVIKNRHNPI